MGNFIKARPHPTIRTVHPSNNISSTETRTAEFQTNRIRTTKYTLLTCLPKNLYEQFHRVANVYFVFIALLNFVPDVEAFSKEAALVPIILVIAVPAIKDAYEDYQRYIADKRINNQTCRAFSWTDNLYTSIKWQEVNVGDFVRLSCNEIIPADILLLKTSEVRNICHVDTCSLDGETNLKQRQAVSDLQFQGHGFHPTRFPYSVQCEAPNEEIYKFQGTVLSDNVPIVNVIVNKDNVLLRGCTLRNTDYVEGLVIYAGHETKAMLNNHGPRYKRSKLERLVNRDVCYSVGLLAVLCVGSAVGSGFWVDQYPDQASNVPFLTFSSFTKSNPYFQGFIKFWTFIILYQTVIPLALYVTVEGVKAGQVYFINHDLELYDAASNRRTTCRALNITEDLGQIEYIFSDKTGTLTENQMEFKACTIGGVDYPHSFSDISIKTAKKSKSFDNQMIIPNLIPDHALQQQLSSMAPDTQLRIPEESRRIHDFFLAMAICNTVVVSRRPHHEKMNSSNTASSSSLSGDKTIISNGKTSPTLLNGTVNEGFQGDSNSSNVYPIVDDEIAVDTFDDGFYELYESESPDELALVRAASTYGCRLHRRTIKTVDVILPDGQEVEYEILNVLPFDNERKRMSVIIRNPISREITLLTKGSDSSVIAALDPSFSYADQAAFKETTLQHLTAYAMTGLRTLCMAKKVLTVDDYMIWHELHQRAEGVNEHQSTLLYESACRIEKDLHLLGATGIEDKLQDGVSETIEHLRQAGIKIWVLTGDKQETAIQVAYACKLFNNKQDVTILNETNKDKALKSIENLSQKISLSESSRDHALVIDGHSLMHFVHDTPAEQLFLSVVQKCASVVCCRTTPIQKADIVKLVKDTLKSQTLAIGDGANDVSMIQSADVGVGLIGQEGMQAVMASDFALPRFRFLERLLLVHGHWCCKRFAGYALYIIYKNLVVVLVLLWFQIFNGFSGSKHMDDFNIVFQQTFYVALIPIIVGIMDQDIDADSLLTHPEFYKEGPKGKMYTRCSFWIILLDTTYQSLVIYFIIHLCYLDSDVDMAQFGLVMFTALNFVTMLHLAIEVHYWTWIHAASMAVGFLVFCIIDAVMDQMCATICINYGVLSKIFSTPFDTLIIILTTVLALAPRFIIRAVQGSIFPSNVQRQKHQSRLHANSKKDSIKINRYAKQANNFSVSGTVVASEMQETIHL